MKWTLWSDIPNTFMIMSFVSVFVVGIGILILLLSIGKFISATVTFIMMCILIFVPLNSGALLDNNFNEDERMIIYKAIDELDARVVIIPEDQERPLYNVTVDDEKYTFIVNDMGMNVNMIIRNENSEIIYELSEKELDESLTKLGRIAASKIRNIAGTNDVYLTEVIDYDRFKIKANNKSYDVKVSDIENEVEFIIHNDIYIYEKGGN